MNYLMERGRLEFITRDKDYEYRHIVLYRVNGYYTLEQLKNMLLDVKVVKYWRYV